MLQTTDGWATHSEREFTFAKKLIRLIQKIVNH